MSTRPSIKSIAKALGISHMTVSRALSERGSVSPKTREAVLNYARSVGYVKSAAAESMRGGYSRIVGLLLPNIVNEYYARVADRMAEACRARDHHLIVHITNDDPEAEGEAFERLMQLQAAGIVYVPAPGATQKAPAFAGQNCVQAIRRRPTGEPQSFVGLDDATAIAEAARRLAESGCRKVAMIAGGRDLSTGKARQDAFLKGLRAAGLGDNAAVIMDGKPSFALGRQGFAQALDDAEVTGIVCGGFEISNGAVSAYLELPQEQRNRIKLIGYGDPSFYAWLDGGISTINPPVYELADKALELLLGQGAAGGAPRDVLFPTELKIRRSSEET